MKKRDFLIAVVLIIFSAAAIIAAQEYPQESRVMPNVYSALLIILSMFLIKRSLKNNETEKETGEHAPYRKFFMVTASILLYIILVRFLGFYSSTLIFMLSFMFMVKAAKTITVIIISLSTTGLIYTFFDLMLHIPIPRGLLF